MSNQYYDGDVSFEWNGKQYEATVHATATYSFRKGRMYMPNGDPGYPDEEDFEIDDIDDIEVVFDEDGNEVPYDDRMYDALERALRDVNWEEDEPEPDYDDYEERAIARYEAMCDRYDAQ